MKPLVVTQTINQDDPVLGFFHRWVEELAQHAEQVEVICLKEGKHALPGNVRVHSLGKEHPPRFARRAVYAARFLSLAWRLRRNYDAVFVHMNQEYVLLAGWLWQLLGKRVFLWRNHYAGSWLTGVAVAFCTNVFCTSKHSYTAKYAKTKLMPVGVDTRIFHADPAVPRAPRSILFLARIAPSKRVEMIIDALATLARGGQSFTATIVGAPRAEDEPYYAALKKQVQRENLTDTVSFRGAVAHSETPALYSAHELFVNTSPSGMFDKTLFEAAACGCQVLASSDDWRTLAGDTAYFDSAETLAARLREGFASGAAPLPRSIIESNTLTYLGQELIRIMSAS